MSHMLKCYENWLRLAFVQEMRAGQAVSALKPWLRVKASNRLEIFRKPCTRPHMPFPGMSALRVAQES